MGIKLKKKWVEYLASVPESGMGYQIVDVTLKDGRVLKNTVVFNAEDLKLLPEYRGVELEDVKEIKLSDGNGK